MEEWVGGRVVPGGQRGMRPQGFGYLFLVSRLGEVSPLCAGLGWLQVWIGCLWGTCGGSQDYVIGGGLRIGQISFSRS